MRTALLPLLGLTTACASVLGLDEYHGRDGGAVDSSAPDDGRSDATETDARTCSAEVCTPTDTTQRAIDEDCDGRIDEGPCVWSFGEPHFITTTQIGLQLQSPLSSSDGLRLYFVSALDGTVWLASRPSLGAPFEAPVEVEVTGMPPGWLIVGITLRNDEREMFVEASDGAEQDLFQAVRAATDGPFTTTGMPLSATAADAIDASASLSHDGLELFFTSNRDTGTYTIHRSGRSDPDGEFAVAQPVTLMDTDTMNVDSPRLSLDGRTLFFRAVDSGGMDYSYYATRDSAGSIAFGRPTSLEGIDTTFGDFHLFPSERTGEAFFISTRPWSPGLSGIWRARLCRDGPCPSDPIDCVAPAMRSPGGDRCYSHVTTGMTFDEARAVCEATGGHLVTLHSSPEAEVAVAVAGGPTWIGALDGPTDAFAWLTGEPPPGMGFPTGRPSVRECLTVETSGTVWTPSACTERHEHTCERETWPVW